MAEQPLCWVCCTREVTDQPPELSLAEREACEDCRPTMTFVRESLAMSMLVLSVPVNKDKPAF